MSTTNILEGVQLRFELGGKPGVSIPKFNPKESQTTRILRLLRSKPAVTNKELNRICFRYSARLGELRSEGYIIVTNHVKDGLFEYVYRGKTKEGRKDR